MQMIVEPEQRVADFAKAGADIISVHADNAATIHLHRTINQVKELGCLAGAVLNPGTSLREIEEVRCTCSSATLHFLVWHACLLCCGSGLSRQALQTYG